MILSLLNDAYVKTHSWAFEGQAEKRCKPGRPLPLTQLRIVDGEMNDLPHDGKTSGELVVRAPWLTQGYFKDPKGSEKLWAGGWLHTGVADPKWIERPLGLLVAKPCQEVSEEQIMAHLQSFVEKGIITMYFSSTESSRSRLPLPQCKPLKLTTQGIRFSSLSGATNLTDPLFEANRGCLCCSNQQGNGLSESTRRRAH